MLAGPQHDVPVLPFEVLLRQTNAHLLCAERHVIVIKRQHRSSDRVLRTLLPSAVPYWLTAILPPVRLAARPAVTAAAICDGVSTTMTPAVSSFRRLPA